MILVGILGPGTDLPRSASVGSGGIDEILRSKVFSNGPLLRYSVHSSIHGLHYSLVIVDMQ